MMNRFYAWATALIAESKNEDGQTAVEYALMLAIVVVGLVTLSLWTNLDGAIGAAIQKVVDAINPPA
jgi:Flp pilus assembly pilin Flp